MEDIRKSNGGVVSVGYQQATWTWMPNGRLERQSKNLRDRSVRDTKPLDHRVYFKIKPALGISHLQIQVGQKAADVLKAKHGTNYRAGSSADSLCKTTFLMVSKAQKKSMKSRWWDGPKSRSSCDPQRAGRIERTKDQRKTVWFSTVLSRDKVWVQRKNNWYAGSNQSFSLPWVKKSWLVRRHRR